MIKGLFPVVITGHLLFHLGCQAAIGGMRETLTFLGALCKSSKSLLKFISHLITATEQRQCWRTRISSLYGPGTGQIGIWLSCRVSVMTKPVWRDSKVCSFTTKVTLFEGNFLWCSAQISPSLSFTLSFTIGSHKNNSSSLWRVFNLSILKNSILLLAMVGSGYIYLSSD